MLLAALPLQSVQGQTGYTEKLNVYVAGSDALWYFTFGGINGSTKLSSFESTPGLSSYNITAIKTTSWQSDFQVFGPGGYNLIPVPFIPSQGLFLKVTSDSYADASAAAASLGSYFFTSFISLSNGTGTYSFYSPVSFSSLMPATLLKFVPSASIGGFASAIGATFSNTASPFLVLEGQKSASGFGRSLVVGSISSTALDSTGKPALLGYFGSSPAFLQPSTHSTSSVVQLNFLDGIVRSTDKATIANDAKRFSGSYTLNLAQGHKLTKVNATVVEEPVPLLATRTVDVGVLHTGDHLAVTLSLRNLSPSDTITKMSFSDTWWNKTGMFTLLKGSNDTAPSTGIIPGGGVTPVYNLQYTGTETSSFTIPASIVRYTYQHGGVSFNATAVLNPIRLSLGADDAVVVTSVIPLGSLGASVGQTQKVNVTVTNVGTLPASSVNVAGHSIAGLGARTGSSAGGTASVTLSLNANGLTGVNLTKSYATTYLNPSGTSLNATTNILPVVFSHKAMNVGFPSLTVNTLLTTISATKSNLTLAFVTSNVGPVNVTSFKATATLPQGLGCGVIPASGVGNKGLSCTANVLTIHYPVVNKSSTLTGYMKYNITRPANFLLDSIGFSAASGGSNVTGRSNAVPIPAGVAVTKVFNPGQLFGGMKSQVTVSATNAGPFAVYNATLFTTTDIFDSLTAQTSLSKSSPTIAGGGNATFSYGVQTAEVSGNLSGTAATASFYFGGTSFSVSGIFPTVNAYQLLSASISTSPATPQEGKNFTITFKITNPSGVQVSNVLFSLPVPSGLGLSKLQNAVISGGQLTISASSLGPRASTTATASAVASSGITIPFSGGKLTFSYAGNTINGVLPAKSGIAISEDVTTRYLIPTGIILLVTLAVAFYVRRMAAPTALSSQK